MTTTSTITRRSAAKAARAITAARLDGSYLVCVRSNGTVAGIHTTNTRLGDVGRNCRALTISGCDEVDADWIVELWERETERTECTEEES